jgi:hypothetical protein
MRAGIKGLIGLEPKGVSSGILRRNNVKRRSRIRFIRLFAGEESSYLEVAQLPLYRLHYLKRFE